MGRYALRRAMHAAFVVLAISVIVFFTMRLSGDPAQLMLAEGNPSPEDLARLRTELGLDRPLYVQYGIFLANAVRGDFGDSWRYETAAFPLVVERLPATLQLTFASMFVAILIAFPIGIISAIRRDGIIDMVARLIALLGVSFPSFWLGIILIMVVAVRLNWLPVSGRGGFSHLILPAVTLGMGQAAILMRLLRASMLEVLSADYIKTARSKGLTDMVIYARHALRNALIPVITVVGLQFGHLLGGAIIVEVVFAWPGMGLLVVQAIGFRDYSIVQAVVVLMAFVFVLINFLVDLSYVVLDPRIKLS